VVASDKDLLELRDKVYNFQSNNEKEIGDLYKRVQVMEHSYQQMVEDRDILLNFLMKRGTDFLQQAEAEKYGNSPTEG
jgi:hypothetical protein